MLGHEGPAGRAGRWACWAGFLRDPESVSPSPKMPLPSVDSMLAPEGWAYASAPPVDADDPGRFHALFGRDSLIFALQVLPTRPEIAVATLRILAGLQGRRVDAEIDEEPGKILHEYRPAAPSWLVDAGWPIRHGQLLYYGSADATSWFLVVLAATRDKQLIRELADAWRAAAGWLERALDRGDGTVWHGPRTSSGGLSQQGWRDSQDPAVHAAGGGILRRDGTTPLSPLADADSQAVAVAALHALTVLDPDRSAHWRSRLAATRARIEKDFTPEVMALEAGGEPVLGAGSQLGWLLWADALTGEAAAAAIDRLLRPDVCTAFGLRTLAAIASSVSTSWVPPRVSVAVRQLAGLGRPPGGRLRRGSRTSTGRCPHRGRRTRLGTGAVCGHHRRPTGVDPGLQQGSGMDPRGNNRAADAMGRSAQLSRRAPMPAVKPIGPSPFHLPGPRKPPVGADRMPGNVLVTEFHPQ